MKTWQVGTLTYLVYKEIFESKVFFPEGLSNTSLFIFLISLTPQSPPGLTNIILRLVLVGSDDHTLASSPLLPPSPPCCRGQCSKAAAHTHGNNIRYAEAGMTQCPPKISLKMSYQSSFHGGWDNYLDPTTGARTVLPWSHPWHGLFLVTYSLPRPLKHKYIQPCPQKHGQPHSPYNQTTKKILKFLAISVVLKTNNSYTSKTVILREFPNLRKENMKVKGFSANLIQIRDSLSLGQYVSLLEDSSHKRKAVW